MATSWSKKERENKKREQRKKKEERKQERKENTGKGKSLDDMMAYLDENGNLTTVPPDPSKKKVEIDLDSIQIGVPKQPEITENTPRKGIVSFFNEKKGFGFIQDEESGERVFVHQSASKHPLKESSVVSFEIEKGPRGLTAVEVTPLK